LVTFDKYEPIALRTPHVVLEPLCAAHAAEMFKPLFDPIHYQFIPQDPPASLEVLRARFERLEGRRSPNGRELWLNWALRLASGEAVGLVQATGYPDGRISIAYELFRAHQGRGIATQAVRAMLLHLRDQAKLNRATALVDTRNQRSIRLLERLGFSRTRLIVDAAYFKGAPSDEYEYALDLAELRQEA
jgi:[ribosomal protein S5]-alanine N-acetyltransferase